ncbi:MAG: A/G-specific adenine glycosylase [Magnetococcales bacterium]|nr:A/G-specific adenine glycosylase [Magnetococcales bacterium]MBF0323179.1 A/G-specific adenine glycosylase [Magnetococcales bacterium]
MGTDRLHSRPMKPGLADLLLAHYDGHRRDLPWRSTRDPYRIWLAEIMLQQTTVATAIPYYTRFLTRFPDMETLAAASLEEVLGLWQGLGYYRRARFLHAAARQVVARHGGCLPTDFSTLVQLPGIGPSTAGAILAIAHDQHHAILDGNVQRVLARLLALDQPVAMAKKTLWESARRLTPTTRPGDYAQAIMDLGATLCTPRQPACTHCPWKGACRAHALDRVQDFPRPQPRKEKPRLEQLSLLLVRDGTHILLCRRPEQKLLGGLWEPPGSEPATTLAPQALRELTKRLGVQIDRAEQCPTVRHSFTHFHLTAQVWKAAWCADEPTGSDPTTVRRWVSRDEVDRLPIATLHRKILMSAE